MVSLTTILPKFVSYIVDRKSTANRPISSSNSTESASPEDGELPTLYWIDAMCLLKLAWPINKQKVDFKFSLSKGYMEKMRITKDSV